MLLVLLQLLKYFASPSLSAIFPQPLPPILPKAYLYSGNFVQYICLIGGF